MSDVTLNPSITPSFTSTPAIQNVPAPAAEETGPKYTPLWMVNDSIGSNAFEMLGMRLPNASGDIAAMLAQISLTLELTIDESDKNKALSSLAKLASALGAYGVTSLREMIGRNEQGSADTAERVSNYSEAAAGLVDQRKNLNDKISDYNGQISSLQHDISTLEGEKAGLQDQLAKAKDSDKPAIQAQIDAKTTSIAAKTTSLNAVNDLRNQALASRKEVEISLANLKIDTLTAEITDLQEQLALAPEGSDEATKLTALISDLNDRLASMEDHRGKLKTETYTENSGNGHFSATDSKFTGAFNNVTDTLGKLVSDGLTELQNIITMVLTLAAQAATEFNTANSNAASAQGQREITVERNFDDISDELKATGQRLQTMLRDADNGDQARVDRIGEIARGLLAAISDIVQALDGLDASGAGAPPVGQTVGSRLRLGV